MKMLNKLFKPILTIFCVLWIGKEILFPIGVALFTYQPYMELVRKCDAAMTSSWYIKQRHDDLLSKSELVQMLDCHDYDKLRKIMLISGLPENYLSYLGLTALEIHQRPAEELVEQHRFTER